MINWKKEAIEELKRLEDLKESIHHLNERIELIQNQLYNISAVQIGERVGGSGDGDDVRLSKMVELEELKARKLITEKRVQLLQDCLDKLSEEQRLILNRFYIRRTSDYIEELEEVLYKSRTQIYQEKDRALRRLVRLLYGIGIE
ncbi:MAG: hypothetical protein E7475_07995 [Ruminococcaceae bacterium]|nr:hypothetical protein [Oscillospiraceae bacterium]